MKHTLIELTPDFICEVLCRLDTDAQFAVLGAIVASVADGVTHAEIVNYCTAVLIGLGESQFANLPRLHAEIDVMVSEGYFDKKDFA